jgi:hypothetical protein
MKLNELIKIVKEKNLIEDQSDIEFLFLDYKIEDDMISINDLIDNVITWAYENDALSDFYSEHLDFFIDSGIINSIHDCTLYTNTSIRTTTTFDLYCFESKNKNYYTVTGSGEFADCFDTSGFYDIRDKKKDTDIISKFESDCNDVYTVDDEFDSDDLESDGHTIEFDS